MPVEAAGLAEWLDLHEMTAAQMLALLALAPPAEPELRPEPPQPEPPLPLTAEACWSLAAAALAAAMPEGGPVISRAREKTRRDLGADPVRFPRAFTLWQAEGGPYVSCPFQGRLRDLLILAHEFGHCCQFYARPGPQPPPILRETAAYLAELMVLQELSRADPPLHLAVRALFDRQSRRLMTAPRQKLEAALQAGTGRYRYDWNYPPARALALHLAGQGARADLWRIFAGSESLPDLLGSGPGAG